MQAKVGPTYIFKKHYFNPQNVFWEPGFLKFHRWGPAIIVIAMAQCSQKHFFAKKY